MRDYNSNKEHAYSQKVKAGKRTYFFDVKTTQRGDYYLVITESRKNLHDADANYTKNKLFLYKEDLNNFVEALQRTTRHIKEQLLPDYDFNQNRQSDHHQQQD